MPSDAERVNDAGLLSLAVTRLDQGKNHEAAPILQVHLDLRPGDPEIQNNLGFCLIPTQPKQAASTLRQALENGVGKGRPWPKAAV